MTASSWGRSFLLSRQPEKTPERFSAGVKHPVVACVSMGLDSPASRRRWGRWIQVPEAFSVEELTEQRDWEEGSRDNRVLSRRGNEEKRFSGNIKVDVKIIPGEGGSFLRGKDSIAQKKMLGEFLPDSTENFAE